MIPSAFPPRGELEECNLHTIVPILNCRGILLIKLNLAPNSRKYCYLAFLTSFATIVVM